MDLYFGKPLGNKIILDPDESNHLINVKRSRNDDIILVTDGEGNIYTTKIFSLSKKECSLEIIETKTTEKKSFRLHIAIAPTKNIDRVEWFLEKAVETGIDEISFLNCRHSERKEIKTERLQRVIISAMKQSIKSYLPQLNPMIDFKKFAVNKFTGIKFICTTSADSNDNIKKYYQSGKDLLALIGPEGDFHPDEVALAKENGFQPLTLGESRLRTETAALNICTVFNFINTK